MLFKAQVLEAVAYGCVTSTPTVVHLAILRTAHHRLLHFCIGWNIKPRSEYHVCSYARALAEPGCDNVETAVPERAILLEGFVARMSIERLPKDVMFVEQDQEEG